MAWCWQKQNQWDAAVNTYAEVTKLTTAEVAARAQYNIGVCRFAQQRWQEAADAYQLCAYTYDYSDLSSQGLVEAAAALEALKKVPDAAKLLTQVGKDYPKSKAAVAAAERLAKLPVMQ
jgi:cellulose synthase operon protein C